MSIIKTALMSCLLLITLFYKANASADILQITGNFSTLSFTPGSSPFTTATGNFITDLFNDTVFLDGNFHQVPLQSLSITLDGTEYWTESDAYLRARFNVFSGSIFGLDVAEITGLVDFPTLNCCFNFNDFLLAFTGNSPLVDPVNATVFEYSDPTSTTVGSWTAATSNISGSAFVSTVPVPAAVWLFGSGLLGLVGVARRKKAA